MLKGKHSCWASNCATRTGVRDKRNVFERFLYERNLVEGDARLETEIIVDRNSSGKLFSEGGGPGPPSGGNENINESLRSKMVFVRRPHMHHEGGQRHHEEATRTSPGNRTKSTTIEISTKMRTTVRVY